MSNRRLIHWGRALSDLHADRLVLPARALIEGLARMRGTALVTPTGAFDRSAIMVAAVEAAKAHQRRTGDA